MHLVTVASSYNSLRETAFVNMKHIIKFSGAFRDNKLSICVANAARFAYTILPVMSVWWSTMMV